MAMGRSQSPTPGFTVGQAMAIFATSISLLLLTGSLFVRAGVVGVLLAQLVCLGGVPAVAALLRHGTAAHAALGLRRPSLRVLAGAVCMGASFWYLNLWLAVPIAERLLGGNDELARLEGMIEAAPFWLSLVALAAAPALCEELLLRGVIARALRPTLGRLAAICISAVLFALLHFSLARLLPTAIFGVLLAAAALATGSIVPGIVIHALNNAMALALASDRLPALAAAIDGHPDRVGMAALALCLGGSILLRSQPREIPAKLGG